jgi:hypothetical protein
MIIKDKFDLDLKPCFDQQIIHMKCGLTFDYYVKGINEIANSNNPFNLKNDLLE